MTTQSNDPFPRTDAAPSDEELNAMLQAAEREHAQRFIQVWEWFVDGAITAEVTGEPLLVDDYDGEDMWFEVDIRFEGDDEPWFAIYNEQQLRWEFGDN